jgi:hypothetical protein
LDPVGFKGNRVQTDSNPDRPPASQPQTTSENVPSLGATESKGEPLPPNTASPAALPNPSSQPQTSSAAAYKDVEEKTLSGASSSSLPAEEAAREAVLREFLQSPESLGFPIAQGESGRAELEKSSGLGWQSAAAFSLLTLGVCAFHQRWSRDRTRMSRIERQTGTGKRASPSTQA